MNRNRQIMKRSFAAVLPRRALVVNGSRHSGSLALTFDDGPHAEYTPAVLDELQRLDVRATFFVVGQQAARHPELIQRILDEGHCLGHHSWFHTEPSRTTAEELLTEVDACREHLERTHGIHTTFFRPPKGALTAGKAIGLWLRSQTIVLWNVDPRDFAMISCSQARQWCEAYEPASGDIVLLHDNRPCAREMIAPIVERARPRLEFGTIADWIPDRVATSAPNARQEKVPV